jgi:endonuclease/exonuclease/phosphatase family metal-dependent hydrolase
MVFIRRFPSLSVTPFFAVAMVCFAAASPAARGEKLTVLCYNIHYGQGNDGEYDLQRLAEVIRRAKPDLVALQEVDVGVQRSGRVHEAQRLAELTGMAVRFGPTQHFQGGLFGNAVLTKMPILDVRIQPLPYTESTPEKVTYPRGAIAVTVQRANGKSLRFISTHFQHNVPEDRVAEAKAINQLFAAASNVPTILAGDINAQPESEPLQILLSEWTAAIEDPPLPTAPALNPTSRIDHVFFRPQADFRLLASSVMDEPMASDHRPVRVVLDVDDPANR